MNTHVRERAIFVQSSLAFLTRLDAMIEELIAMRDALDGDPDFEPDPDNEESGDDEPTLGAPEAIELWEMRHAWARGATHEGEAEVTIGTACQHTSQEYFARTYAVPDDAEDSHDAEEDRADDEPPLGAPERHAATDSQDDWAQGGPWGDETEVTMPNGFQCVDPRLRGYLAPDDAEECDDLEPDADLEPDGEGEGRTEYASQWDVKMRPARQVRRPKNADS